jgi:hypothetical protein
LIREMELILRIHLKKDLCYESLLLMASYSSLIHISSICGKEQSQEKSNKNNRINTSPLNP